MPPFHGRRVPDPYVPTEEELMEAISTILSGYSHRDARGKNLGDLLGTSSTKNHEQGTVGFRMHYEYGEFNGDDDQKHDIAAFDVTIRRVPDEELT